MRVPLRETVYVNFSGAGAATAKIGPLTAREVWYPQNVAINANSNPTNESSCSIYVGDSYTQALRDASTSGSSGDATDKVNGDRIRSGEFVWAIWTGGDAGVQARMTVTGEKEI